MPTKHHVVSQRTDTWDAAVRCLRSVALCCLLLAVCVSPAVSRDLPELLGVIRADTQTVSFGERILPLGDFDNDGYDDIFVDRGWFSWYLYYGGNPFDTVYDYSIDSLSTNANVAPDLNNDGYADVVGWLRLQPHLFVWFGGPAFDAVPDMRFGIESLYGVGYTAAGDYDSDGAVELASRSNQQNSVVVYEASASSDSLHELMITPAGIPWDGYVFAEGIASGDFNGDGTEDLAVSLRRVASQELNGKVYLFWGGVAFDTIPDLVIRRPGGWIEGAHAFGRILENVGDLNGDGYDDLFAGCGVSFDDTTNFIYFCGPDIDTIADIVLHRRLSVARAAGDVNSDGYDDLIVSYPTPFSGSGEVRIYLGGPDIDDIPDLVIDNTDMPEYEDLFGLDCSGVGDVNGDGVDDFAFSARGNFERGKIYVFAGWDQGTAVETVDEPALPDAFTLSQNYPNPFNPSTTIEFDLPVRSSVTVTVLNVLGQRVIRLKEGELSAGTHRLVWDGRDADGRVVGSGVYFYRVAAGNMVLSKKMLLLR